MARAGFLPMNPVSISGLAAYRRYAGLLVFLVSVLVALQLIWVIEHQRPDETLVRTAAAALVGLLLGMAMIQAVERLFPAPARAVSRRVAHALWPAFLLLFMPFHVRLLCRWQNECGYAGDIFMLQFLVLAVTILFARPLYEQLAPKVESLGNTQIARMVRKHPFAFAFALTLTLLLIRGWGRFAHPEFFAEGGVVYFKGALREGWSSLFDTYTGFLHVFPRVVLLTGFELLPLEYLTRFTVSLCFALTALVSANFVRPTYRWLVPSDAARWMICVLLVLAPGLFEILGNLTNLHYVMFAFVALVLLRNPADNHSLLELVCVAFTVLSTSLTIGLIPLAAYRVYLKRVSRRNASTDGPSSGRSAWREWAILLMLCFPPIWSIQDIILHPTNAGITPVPVDLGLPDLIKGLVNISTIYYLLFPLAGNKTINELLPYFPPFILLVPLAVFVTVRMHALWREDRVRAGVVMLWLAAMGAVIVMIFFARTVGFKVVFLTNWGHHAWWGRYDYLTAMPAVLMWFLLLRPRSIIDLRKTAAVVALIVFSSGLFHARYIFEIGRYTEQEYWKETARELKQSFATGCPSTVEVDVFPNRGFTYKNPDSSALDCPPDKQVP